jgi:hypothetical protein
LAREDSLRTPQTVSNIIYAAAKAGADPSGWQLYIAAVVEGYEAGTAMHSAKPQSWSNMLWACKKLEVYSPAFMSIAAGAVVQDVLSATPQDLANTLIVLAGLGWYEPDVYDSLLLALVDKAAQSGPQHVCNGLYACCIAQHNSDAVQLLAKAILSRSNLQQWISQDVSNTLYACMALTGHVSSSSLPQPTSVMQLSKPLFEPASQRDPATYSAPDIAQLHRAHIRAQQLSIPGLAQGSRMLAHVEHLVQRDIQRIIRQPPILLQREVNQAAAATGRYTPIATGVRGGRVVAGEVKHNELGFSLAVYALDTGKNMRHPSGRLTGAAQLYVNHLASFFPAVVVVYENEWAALGGDADAQKGHMERLLQQAEAAVAAAAAQQQEHQLKGGMEVQGQASQLLSSSV